MTDKLHHHAIAVALDHHHIWARTRQGRYWLVRRNGATKLWKTRPEDFKIPVKAGLKDCFYITHDSCIGLANPQDAPDLLISQTDPNISKPDPSRAAILRSWLLRGAL